MANSPLGNLIENELKEKQQRKLDQKKAKERQCAREEFYKEIIADDCKKYTVFNENDETRIFKRKIIKEKPKAPSLQRQYGQTLNYNIDNQARKNSTPPSLSRGLPGHNKNQGTPSGQKLLPSNSANNSSSLIQSIFKK